MFHIRTTMIMIMKGRKEEKPSNASSPYTCAPDNCGGDVGTVAMSDVFCDSTDDVSMHKIIPVKRQNAMQGIVCYC
jgi:hypothetical protein